MSDENKKPASVNAGQLNSESVDSELTVIMPSPVPSVNLALRREIAESVLGPVEWTDASQGFCPCPGSDKHTCATQAKDCKVFVDGVPTLNCFHQNCREDVERMTAELRRAVESSETGVCYTVITPDDSLRERQKAQSEKRRLTTWAKGEFPQILASHAWPVEQITAQSPVPLPDDHSEHWRLLLGLFAPDDVIWIGRDVRNTGHRRYYGCFRSAADWLAFQPCPGVFICPSTFRPFAYSRSNKEIRLTRFLVVESDHLNKDQIGAVFRWLTGRIRLRAIVDTAGKSLHGWFNYPSPELLEELKVILPQFCCDRAMFTPSQPCRLPGAFRDGRHQRLLWLDSEVII